MSLNFQVALNPVVMATGARFKRARVGIVRSGESIERFKCFVVFLMFNMAFEARNGYNSMKNHF